jgi:GAF domain-containing protein
LAHFRMCVPESQALATNEVGATSVLAIPLKSSQGDVLGILELFNAKDPESDQIIPFDSNLQEMMESFSSLAVAALEAYNREQKLHLEIQELRIEIDEVKRQKQISEIVETDFFQDLQEKARAVRDRRSQQQALLKETE